MADDKIKISWDEVSSAEVDSRVKHQETLARSQQHYERSSPGPQASPLPIQSTSLLYNTVLYMALFGAAGGLVAWIGGEVIGVVLPNYVEQLTTEVSPNRDVILQRLASGELNQAQADAMLSDLEEQYRDNPYVAILTDNTLSPEKRDAALGKRIATDAWRNFVQQLIVFSIIAMSLGLFLSIADSVVAFNGRAILINGSVGIAVGLLGGIVVGLFINKLYNAIGGGQSLHMATQVMARTVGWAILGLFLAIAPGVVLLSFKRFVVGLVGGFLGGLLGGLLFDGVSYATGSIIVSRFVAIMAIGIFAGAGTGLIESVAKSGWIKVVGGFIAGKQFVLYKNPTLIGSTPQAEIYLFKDPQVAPHHAAIHLVRGGFELEDLRSATGTLLNGAVVTRARLRSGDQIQIGRTTFVFQEKARNG